MNGEEYYPPVEPPMIPNEPVQPMPGGIMGDARHFVQLLTEFIEDDAIPEHIREEFMHFGMTSRHLIFSNLMEEDIVILLRKFFIIKGKFLNSLTSYKITHNLLMKLDNLEIAFRAILTRAKGETRERVLQNTQVRQQISTSDFNKPAKKAGFFGKMLGFDRGQRR